MSVNDKIPKIIHYCWFGGKEKPEIVRNVLRAGKEFNRL